MVRMFCSTSKVLLVYWMNGVLAVRFSSLGLRGPNVGPNVAGLSEA